MRGDLVQEDDAWALVPHKMVGGFELPPTSMLARYKLSFQKMRRFRKIAKREIAKRGLSAGFPQRAGRSARPDDPAVAGLI